MSTKKWQVGLAAVILAVGTAGFLMQARSNAGLRAEIDALRAQQAVVTRLRGENKVLIRAATDVAMLRVDGTELARLREEVAAARRRPPAVSSSRPAQSFAQLPPLRAPDSKVQRLMLPDADINTVLTTIEMLSGWRLVRDASLGRGIINVRTGELTRAEAVEQIRTALRDQAGIILEPGPDGTVLVKRAVGR